MNMRLRADVSTVDTDDGLVLLDERSGKYYQLNSTGAVVLRALVETGSAEAAVRTLCERFPAVTDRIAADVTAVVERTVAHLKGWKGSSSVDSPHNSILLDVDMWSSPCCGGDVSGRVCRAG